MNDPINLDLDAIDLDVSLTSEDLDGSTALGTWGSAGTFSSGSCPASTASSGSTASSAG